MASKPETSITVQQPFSSAGTIKQNTLQPIYGKSEDKYKVYIIKT